MTDRDKQFLKMAENALNRYSISNARLDKVGDMGYGDFGIVKFRVRGKDKKERFLLSILHPRPGYDILRQKQSFESYHIWLEALNRDTDLVVQQPVRNPSGELLTKISTDGSVNGLCTLLHWVKGNVISDDEQPAALSSELVSQMGTVLAKIHQHASRWAIPHRFTRPEFDTGEIFASLEKLKQVSHSDRISDKDFVVIEKVCQKICKHLMTIRKTNNTWGLVHGDFHGGNCLLFEGEVRPIDFDFCGFGYFLYDIAYTFKCLEPDLRGAFIDGYQRIRSLPDTFPKTAEALLVAQRIHRWSILTNVSSFGMVPEIVANEFEMYLRNNRFLFDIPAWDWEEHRLKQ